MKQSDFYNVVNRAFYFLSNFPYFPDMLKDIAPNDNITQQHYKDKFNILYKQCHLRSDAAMLLFYYELDSEHRQNFANCIAKKYGFTLE